MANNTTTTTTTTSAIGGVQPRHEQDGFDDLFEDMFAEGTTDTAFAVMMMFGVLVLVGGVLYCVSRVMCWNVCTKKVFFCCLCFRSSDSSSSSFDGGGDDRHLNSSLVKRILNGGAKDKEKGLWAKKRPGTSGSFREDVFQKDEILYHQDMDVVEENNNRRKFKKKKKKRQTSSSPYRHQQNDDAINKYQSKRQRY